MTSAFTAFLAIRKQLANDFVRDRVLRHKDYVLPERSRPMRSMVFIQMADHFTNGVIGESNRFLIGITHSDGWHQVAQNYDKDEKYSLLWEYAEPHLELSVGRPYSIRNQLNFAICHMLHQGNMLKDSAWKDSLPSDRGIDFKLLDTLGKDWSKFEQFRKAINLLNDKQFKNTTRDYRHRLQHQFRSQFEFGITPYFDRKQTKSGVSYNYTFTPPLKLEVLIPELYRQHQIATKAFLAYWQLVMEICLEWDSRYADT